MKDDNLAVTGAQQLRDAALASHARTFRRKVFDFKTTSGQGHLASALSRIDIVASLYLDEETDFDWEQDTLVFGKAHGGPAVYPVLSHIGLIDEVEHARYCEPEGMLRLHPDWTIPGCVFVGGSLGNGIGYAAGRAFLEPEKRFWVILGDAELYEGAVWESLLFISHHNLNNLGLIIDRNGLAILGATEDLIRLEPLAAKFESFGFDTVSCDGHDFRELRHSLVLGLQPRVVIAETVKGKGVSYMEDKYEYHTLIPQDPELIKLGRQDLS